MSIHAGKHGVFQNCQCESQNTILHYFTVRYTRFSMGFRMGIFALLTRPCRLVKIRILQSIVVFLLHPFRMSYPKALLNRTKLPIHFIAPTHSHVIERTNDRSQTSTLRNRLEGSMQIPTGILQILNHKFVALRVVQRIVFFQFCPQFGKQWNQSLWERFPI